MERACVHACVITFFDKVQWLSKKEKKEQRE